MKDPLRPGIACSSTQVYSLGCITFFRFAEGLRETGDFAAIDARDVRVDVRDLGRNRCETFRQLLLSGFELVQAFLEHGAVGAVLDGYDDPLDFLFDVGQLLAVRLSRGVTLAVEPVGILRPCTHRRVRRLGRHQVVLVRPGRAPQVRHGECRARSSSSRS